MASDKIGDLLLVESISRIDTKIDRLDERLDGIDRLMTIQQQILDEHVRRTGLLEKKIAQDTQAIREQLPASIEGEITSYRNKFAISALKVVGAFAGTGVGLAMLKNLLEFVLKHLN